MASNDGGPGAPRRDEPKSRAGTTTGLHRVSSGTTSGTTSGATPGATNRNESGSRAGGAVVSALSARRAVRAASSGAGFGSDEDDDTGSGPVAYSGPATSTGVQVQELRRWQPSRSDRRPKRQKRRGGGAPRLITFRLVLFFVLLAAIVAAAYALVRWYAMDDWYVGIEHQHLAVYQGRPDGFLWFQPQLVDESPVTTKEVPSFTLSGLRQGRQEPSLSAARRYVTNLHQEYLATHPQGSGSTTTSNSPASGAPSGASTGSTTTTAPTGVSQ